MTAPKEVVALIDRFLEQEEHYSSARYNETQVRREFIDPFFKALGWDIDNSQGFSEAYKDVVHEDAIKIGGSHRAPDYSFRIGGNRKFFLEAKKPSVSLGDDDQAAYQLRRYGWSAKQQLSVLTNFKELAVYDCTKKPSPEDRPSAARVLFFTIEDFVSRWDELAGVLSKTAILRGGFDKFASKKQKRGTSQVDDAFLDEIERWREVLAKNIALRNSSLTQDDLNFVVQATIDRIVFLRICEDRGIEPHGQLLGISKRGRVYKSLCKLFQNADDRYNSGLFHFKKEKDRHEFHDELSLDLEVDDKHLKDLISNLYYPQSPYEFSVIGADILGQVYEQFLGKVIRLTAGHRAVIEEKPEVKKAGGVYYTPSDIVDYIVRNTLGEWLKDKSVQQASALKVLDPACGSGSFLIAAYQFLLTWYLEKYRLAAKPSAQRVVKVAEGEWRLTLKEKKRILLQHIFGVDVDAQAVEVSKLSLLLKVLETESTTTIEQQLELFHERALPDLAANIKCGNSLISSRFYDNEHADLLPGVKTQNINAFDWEREFADVIKAGGFNAIIGNPPYVNAWTMYESSPEIRDYINSTDEYHSADRHWDLYVLFLERSTGLLSKGGLLGFIIPYSYCIQKYAAKSREFLTKHYRIKSIADLRTVRVFKNVPVITVIPIIQNAKPRAENIEVRVPGADATERFAGTIRLGHSVPQKAFADGPDAMWRLDWSSDTIGILKSTDAASLPFGQLVWVNYGAQMSSKKKGGFGKSFVLRDSAKTSTCKKTISGRNLYRYRIEWAGQYVEWSLADKMYGPREPWFFETPKLMVRDITGTHRLELSLDRSKYYCDHTVLCALRACDVAAHRKFDSEFVELSSQYSLELLQGLLGSRLVSAYYYWALTGEGVRTGGGFHTYPNTIRSFPVFDIRKASASQRVLLSSIEKEAKSILSTAADSSAKSPRQLEAIQRKTKAADSKIDALVYELYGLNPKQVELIEAATA